MIYKYNIAYSNRRVSEASFEKIRQRIGIIRNSSDQDISSTVRNTIFVSEKSSSSSFWINTYVTCCKAKSFYAIGAIRTDENYVNQWLILKNPVDGHKKIILNKTETADTNLYRRMTIEEIKDYFNDHEYDV